MVFLAYQGEAIKLTRLMGEIIKDYVWPFRLGEITLWYERRFDGSDRVIIESELFPEHRFIYTIDPFALFDTYDTALIYIEIGKLAGEFFRDIYVEPPSNVYLGEN